MLRIWPPYNTHEYASVPHWYETSISPLGNSFRSSPFVKGCQISLRRVVRIILLKVCPYLHSTFTFQVVLNTVKHGLLAALEGWLLSLVIVAWDSAVMVREYENFEKLG